MVNMLKILRNGFARNLRKMGGLELLKVKICLSVASILKESSRQKESCWGISWRLIYGKIKEWKTDEEKTLWSESYKKKVGRYKPNCLVRDVIYCYKI